MGASATENMLLVGASFLVMACIFFILFGFVFAIKVPNGKEVFAPLTGTREATMQAVETPVSDFSFLWIALLGLSVVVVLIGAKLVFSSYGRQ